MTGTHVDCGSVCTETDRDSPMTGWRVYCGQMLLPLSLVWFSSQPTPVRRSRKTLPFLGDQLDWTVSQNIAVLHANSHPCCMRFNACGYMWNIALKLFQKLFQNNFISHVTTALNTMILIRGLPKTRTPRVPVLYEMSESVQGSSHSTQCHNRPF